MCCAAQKAYKDEFGEEQDRWWDELIQREKELQDQCCPTCKDLRTQSITLALQANAARKVDEHSHGSNASAKQRRLELQRQHAASLRQMRSHVMANTDNHPRENVPLLARHAPGTDSEESTGELDFTSRLRQGGQPSALDGDTSPLPSAGSDSAELDDEIDSDDDNPVCWRGIPKPLVTSRLTAARAKIGRTRISVGDLAVVRLADMDPDWGVAKVVKIRKRSRSLRIHWFGSTKHSANARFKTMWMNTQDRAYAGKKGHHRHKPWLADVRMSMIVDWDFDLNDSGTLPQAVKEYIVTNPRVNWRP
jgi:hypothetical protein